MSLKRLIYYSAVIGGWSAFFGWLATELFLNRPGGEGRVGVATTCALVGGAIGAGLNLVAGMANARWKQQVKRAVPGFIAGSIGGALGGYLGDILFGFGLPRAFGWMIMGSGIGVVEGLYERSSAKLRNGLIGGSIGGLAGGFLFDPIQRTIGAGSGMSSRATAFVILGLCIGLLIGLVKVVLKTAWVTVLDGYRPGRQLILAEGRAVLGRAEYATLPFLGRGDGDLDLEHARIVRQSNGQFVLEDNNTRLGTSVNNQRVNGSVPLKDNDIIKLGTNMIRFSERQRHSDEPAIATAPAPVPAAASAPPPQAYAPAPPPFNRPLIPRMTIPPLSAGGRPAPSVPPPVDGRPVGAPPPLGTRPAPVIPPPPGGQRPVGAPPPLAPRSAPGPFPAGGPAPPPRSTPPPAAASAPSHPTAGAPIVSAQTPPPPPAGMVRCPKCKMPAPRTSKRCIGCGQELA